LNEDVKAIPGQDTDKAVKHEDIVQVVLHNDDVNSMEYVLMCLMRVFGHPTELAAKIMLEAHRKGQAIAEVEGETEARKHHGQLCSFGLIATVERI
jgi:ATP-dependent Clp protease adaptor protein ClpS